MTDCEIWKQTQTFELATVSNFVPTLVLAYTVDSQID